MKNAGVNGIERKTETDGAGKPNNNLQYFEDSCCKSGKRDPWISQPNHGKRRSGWLTRSGVRLGREE